MTRRYQLTARVQPIPMAKWLQSASSLPWTARVWLWVVLCWPGASNWDRRSQGVSSRLENTTSKLLNVTSRWSQNFTTSSLMVSYDYNTVQLFYAVLVPWQTYHFVCIRTYIHTYITPWCLNVECACWEKPKMQFTCESTGIPQHIIYEESRVWGENCKELLYTSERSKKKKKWVAVFWEGM